MFERFTGGARHAVGEAQVEAHELRHNFIGTEHLLLGVLRSGGPPVDVLRGRGITVEAARERVVAIVPSGSDDVPGRQVPFTPRAKKVLELALRRGRDEPPQAEAV